MCWSEGLAPDIDRIGSQKEPWRYRLKTDVQPRSKALQHGDPFHDPSTVKPIDVTEVDPYELNYEFEEVPDEILDSNKWTDAFSVRMQMPEHITLLEGRAVVGSLRHKFRSVSEFSKKHLHLNDNMSVCLMCSKGRSGAYSMLRVCRRICCLLLATDSLLSVRWIPSEKNVADRASRRWEHLRRFDASSRSKQQTRLQEVEAACYPTWPLQSGASDPCARLFSEAGQVHEGTADARQAAEDREGEGEFEEKKDLRQGRSSEICRTNQFGEDGSICSGGSGLFQENDGFQKFCQAQEVETAPPHEQIRHGLLLVSQQSFRTRSRIRRRQQVSSCSHRQFPRMWPAASAPKIEESAAGLAKTGSSTNQTPTSMVTCGVHGYVYAGKKHGSSCCHDHVDVQCLCPTGGSIQFAEGRPGGSYAGSSMVFPSSASSRTTRNKQSRAIRRKPIPGCNIHTMVGKGSSNVGQSGSVSVQRSIHQSGKCLETSPTTPGASHQPCHSLPAAPLRSKSQPTTSPAFSLGGQAAGKMDGRQFSNKARDTCTSSCRVSSSSQKGSKQVSSGRETTGEGGPKIFRPQGVAWNGRYIVELFSGVRVCPKHLRNVVMSPSHMT